ncbi:helix-turn-helix domain-containing protein [Hydrogenophaga sp. PBL-H3]|uniref:helix-turn-helix domain-containing protein n=1 Tax=Hydrogenophaga sp. PBL-H3 TaxID=434010 RepID=UPI003FA5AEE4
MVWENYPEGGSELLALLALADWSNDAGACFPSIAAIAKKTRISRSQAQRVVHGLIDAKFVSVLENSMGGAPGMTRRYRINLEKLTGSAGTTGCMGATPTGRMGATGSASATGRMDAADGSHGCDETGRMASTPRPTICRSRTRTVASRSRCARRRTSLMRSPSSTLRAPKSWRLSGGWLRDDRLGIQDTGRSHTTRIRKGECHGR